MRNRLCLCTDSPEPSGVGEHMLALAASLAGAWDITLAAPAVDVALLSRAAANGLAIRTLPEDERATVSWFASAGFHLVHVHAGIGWEGHGLAASARGAGVPVVLRTEHLPYLITDTREALAYKAGLRHVDRVICVSEFVSASHSAAGVPRERLATIQNGIAPVAPNRTRAETRADLCLDEQRPVIITIARFSPQKGHATLLAAAERVLQLRPDARFLLIGTGPEEGALRAIVERRCLGQAVRFLGRRDDVPDLLQAADLMVLPSLFEGLPLVVLEAMAAQRPVIASRIGGTDEAVVDGLTGRLFEPGDAAGLADAVLTMLAEPKAAEAAGIAGKARFERHFRAARMAAETHELYAASLHTSAISSQNKGSIMQRTRIGFIGAGGIAQRHLGVLEQFQDVEIVAFADTQVERAVEAAARFGARAYASHTEMLAGSALDAVFICVPPFAHGAPERDAVHRRLPFFVEKPLSADLHTAEAISREVAAAGLVTGVGYHWRYLDTVDEARTLLAETPAQLISGYWLDSTPPPQWWWKQAMSGGQVVEQTTHILDLARYLVGEVEQVFGVTGHLKRDDFPGLDIATASSASLKFANGSVGNIASTCVLKWGHRIGLHLFADGLAIELTDREIMVDRGQGRPVRHAEGDPVWREDRDFIDAVKGGPNLIRCSYQEALKTHRLAMAIAQSAADEMPVSLGAPGREIERV
jgi:predicted dehydrogenase/glycosyltransferase involved in cell wall biosynthesis